MHVKLTFRTGTLAIAKRCSARAGKEEDLSVLACRASISWVRVTQAPTSKLEADTFSMAHGQEGTGREREGDGRRGGGEGSGGIP